MKDYKTAICSDKKMKRYYRKKRSSGYFYKGIFMGEWKTGMSIIEFFMIS